MNSIHNNGENDQSLNADLDKLNRVYGQLEQDEPPAMLDQAILNSAHRAVEKKPHWMKFGWLHGLTTAAVFVLAFSIILDQREQAPVYENDMLRNDTVGLQREKVAKKQSPGDSELSVQGFKEKGERSQDMRQNMPAATAPISAEMESAPARELMLEEELMDEVDAMTAAPEAGAISKQARPTAATTGEMKARAEINPDAEQKLQAILKLKHEADERWKTELESFLDTYPNYPLPDELTTEGP